MIEARRLTHPENITMTIEQKKAAVSYLRARFIEDPAVTVEIAVDSAWAGQIDWVAYDGQVSSRLWRASQILRVLVLAAYQCKFPSRDMVKKQ